MTATPQPAGAIALTGRHHYSLGIEALWAEYAALRCPGVYALLADREADAIQLACGLLAAMDDAERADFVRVDGEPEHWLAGLDASLGPGALHRWTLPAADSLQALAGLPEELARGWRRRRGKPRLVLLGVAAQALEAFDAASLARWCRHWHDWTRAHRACLVMIVHGPRSLALRDRLHPHNDVLDGLAHLQPTAGEGRYLVVHWRSDWGVCGGRDLTLASQPPGWRLVNSLTREVSVGDDEHLVLAQQDAVQGHAVPGEHWRLYAEAREVVAQAVSAQAATVILTLDSSEQVEAVARWMHGLRLQRGSALKLVVRELAPCLRYQDERLLTLCGVNLVVGHNITLSRFLSRLEGIQGQRFERPVERDFEALLASLRPLSLGGRVSPAAFIEQLHTWLESDASRAASSLMVALHPAGGLSTGQALRQCHVSRHGDLATVMEGQLYLFLFGCRLTDLDAALGRLFGMPEESLFASRKVFADRETIGIEHQHLIEHGWATETRLPVLEASSGARSMPTEVPQARRPRQVTLRRAEPMERH